MQFCIAYCGILAEHTILATSATGNLVAEATGLPISLYMTAAQGGVQQIGARIAYNEIDLVMFFSDPTRPELAAQVNEVSRLCDVYNVPFASNVATAEVLVHGLRRGDLSTPKTRRNKKIKK